MDCFTCPICLYEDEQSFRFIEGIPNNFCCHTDHIYLTPISALQKVISEHVIRDYSATVTIRLHNDHFGGKRVTQSIVSLNKIRFTCHH